MHLNIRYVVFGCGIFVCICTAHGADISTLKQLKEDVLVGYDKTLRPVRNQTLPVRVYVQYNIGAIVDIAEVLEKFSIAGILYIEWIDELIKWNPTDYDNITTLNLPADYVWHPTLIIVNAFEKIEAVQTELVPVRFFYDGSASFAPANIFHSKCQMDTSYYPWDRQTCYMYFSTLGYYPLEVELKSSRRDVTRYYYIEHGQWKLSNTSAYHGNTNDFSIFALTFRLERKPTFLIVNIMLPIIFMSVLNILVFLVPVQSGERVSYAITVLLAIAVFLTLVGDNLPKVSKPMSVLSFYLLSVLSLSVLICFFTIVNLHIYFKDESIPVPRCLQAITTCCLCLKAKRSKKTKAQRISRPLQKPNVYVIENYRDSEVPRNPRTVSWQEVSIAGDKICFIFCSLALLILTVIHLVSMSKGVEIISNDHIQSYEDSINWQ